MLRIGKVLKRYGTNPSIATFNAYVVVTASCRDSIWFSQGEWPVRVEANEPEGIAIAESYPIAMQLDLRVLGPCGLSHAFEAAKATIYAERLARHP